MKLQNSYFVIRHGFSVPNDKKIIVSSLANGVKPEYGLADKGKQDVASKACSILEKIISTSTSIPGSSISQLQIDFISSPFSRTVETAQIILNEENTSKFSATSNQNDFGKDASRIIFSSLRTDERLRERDFGSLELEGDDSYHQVWEEDLKEQDTNSTFKAESLSSVWNRVKSLVIEEEEKTAKMFKAKNNAQENENCDGTSIHLAPSIHRAVVFVAHGDVLQITQTAWTVFRMNGGGDDDGAVAVVKGLKDHRSLPHMHQAECRKL